MRHSSIDRARGWQAALALLVTCVMGASPIATTKGPDGGGYTGTDAAAYSFVDISGGSGGIGVLAGIDDGTVALALPFTFKFYGKSYALVCVSTNGALYFVANEAACTAINDFANTDLTGVATPGDTAAALPLWSDLTFQTAGAGAVYYQAVGTAPNRRFIVQWNNAYPQGSPNPVTFQAILAESTGEVRFQYKTVTLGPGNAANNGAQATIGIRNAQALANQQLIAWSFGAPVVSNSLALVFSGATLAGDVNRDGVVNCADVNLVRAGVGKRAGQAGYNVAADLNADGIINVLDVTLVSRNLPAGTRC
jgi:hypothetical protein